MGMGYMNDFASSNPHGGNLLVRTATIVAPAFYVIPSITASIIPFELPPFIAREF
jgi:hypothetical protein